MKHIDLFPLRMLLFVIGHFLPSFRSANRGA